MGNMNKGISIFFFSESYSLPIPWAYPHLLPSHKKCLTSLRTATGKKTQQPKNEYSCVIHMWRLSRRELNPGLKRDKLAY
ncbi:hypothetical protein BGZ63DRAFT_392850 [Mariannaea sp. PMI_226]|nr:hypothetical protein BGZ63DRAFT_392850 [Mariannaea sp. PMI_226]